MRIFFFDIETVPTERSLEECGLLDKEVTPENTELLKRLSLSAATAKILCLAYAVEPPGDAPVQILHGDEREILREFWNIVVHCDLFVGHNILDFDLRFMYQRSVIHQIRPSRELPFGRFHNDPIFDTMHECSRWGRESISLDRLSRALSIPSPKENLDGAKVYPYYRAGRLEEICEYCKRDVDSVRQVYRRLTFAGVQ